MIFIYMEINRIAIHIRANIYNLIYFSFFSKFSNIERSYDISIIGLIRFCNRIYYGSFRCQCIIASAFSTKVSRYLSSKPNRVSLFSLLVIKVNYGFNCFFKLVLINSLSPVTRIFIINRYNLTLMFKFNMTITLIYNSCTT